MPAEQLADAHIPALLAGIHEMRTLMLLPMQAPPDNLNIETAGQHMQAISLDASAG